MIEPRGCRVCLLSGAGRGAIALVRAWGPDALAVADRAFRVARPPRLARSGRNRPRFGRIGAGPGDEAVAIVLDGAWPEVEIQCHGGPAARALVLDALISEGAVAASPEDWVAQAGPDPISARAQLLLADAPTLKSAEILLDQATGALGRELLEIARSIDEGCPEAPVRIEALLARTDLGLRLTAGWKVVLTGRPNVGKSRLLNAIAGFDRAIVDPTPGTTRDVVSIRSAVDGWPVEFSDTAGIRTSSDPIESEGIARASTARRQGDVVLLILDRSEPLGSEDRALIVEEAAAIRVANKADLPAAWPASDEDAFEISSSTGAGISGLLDAIARRIVPKPPPEGVGVPFWYRQVARIAEAQRLLKGGHFEAASGTLRGILSDPDSE